MKLPGKKQLEVVRVTRDVTAKNNGRLGNNKSHNQLVCTNKLTKILYFYILFVYFVIMLCQMTPIPIYSGDMRWSTVQKHFFLYDSPCLVSKMGTLYIKQILAYTFPSLRLLKVEHF